MSRFSKVLLLSLLVVGLCAQLALATTSRVQALAGAGQYINDDSDIFRWYGTLPSYSKMVMAEAGGYYQVTEGTIESTVFGYQALGFTHDWGEDHWLGTWAVFLLRNNIEDPSFYFFNPLGTPGMGPVLGELGLGLPTTKFILGWGKDLGPAALGLSFTRSQQMEKPAVGSELDYSFTTFGLGIRWDISESVYYDGSFTAGGAGGDPATVVVDEEELVVSWDKGMSVSGEDRLFWEFAENATLVGFARYRWADYALKVEDFTFGDRWSEWTIGASLDFDVNTNNLLVFAAETQGFNWEVSNGSIEGFPDEISYFVFPRFYVALESDVTSWFTFRVGATKSMVKTTITDATGENEYTWPGGDDFTWRMGGGFHVGEWDIDAVFSPELPFRVGYWLTGYTPESEDPVVSRVSATYRF